MEIVEIEVHGLQKLAYDEAYLYIYTCTTGSMPESQFKSSGCCSHLHMHAGWQLENPAVVLKGFLYFVLLNF